MTDDIKKRQIEDHDLLTRIDANLENFMKRFDDHVKEDNGHFDRLYKKTGSHARYIWMAIGAWAAIQVLIWGHK